MKKITILSALIMLMAVFTAKAQMILQYDGISASDVITLPLAGTVAVTVDWGDGTASQNFATAGNQDHTYVTAGNYTVSITGSLTQFGAYNYPNGNKLTAVSSWDGLGITSFFYAFYNASNLTQVPTSIPSTVTNMSSIFKGASSFNQDLSSWDVSAVANMSFVFNSATSFNQDLSSWDVSAVTDMYSMFRSAISFNQDLSSWDVSAVTNMNYMFHSSTSFNQDLSSWDVSAVTYMSNMFNTATSFNQDLSSWDVSAVTNMADMFTNISLSTPNYDAILNAWSQLTLQTAVDFHGGNSQYSCLSATARQHIIDTYTWTITDGGENPVCPMMLQYDGITAGNTITLPLAGTVNVTVDWGDGTATQDFTSAGNQDHTYATAGNYTVSITGSLTDFGVSGYPNTDKLTAVSSFGDLGITSFTYAFINASNLTQVPSSIPTSVTNMSYMFYGASSFNQDISTWVVNNVTDMSSMFNSAAAFNQDISNWNVGNVTNMNHMFSFTSSFNGTISTWDVSNVTNMEDMFYYATAFNQDISNWNVSSVTSMGSMFSGATVFNQNIGTWDVSNVTGMSEMFYEAYAFDQNLDAWDVSSVNDMSYMFENVTLSTVNYDAILNGWSQLTLQTGVSFHAGNSQYSTCMQAARDILTSAPNNWTITDGGSIADAVAPVPDVATLTDVTAVCEVTTLTAPTATDNCAGTVTVTNNVTLPITAQGTTVVTWTYEDGNSNTSIQTQDVVIDDATNPTITCPTNIVVMEVQSGGYTVVGTEFDPTATDDNCTVANTENDFNSTATLNGETLSVGTHTITWTVTDEAGNTTDCSFDIQVDMYVGINTISENGITIYPNPATNFIVIASATKQSIQNIEVLDITGKTVFNVIASKAKQSQAIDVSNLKQGIYLIKLTTSNTTAVVRFVKK